MRVHSIFVSLALLHANAAGSMVRKSFNDAGATKEDGSPLAVNFLLDMRVNTINIASTNFSSCATEFNATADLQVANANDLAYDIAIQLIAGGLNPNIWGAQYLVVVACDKEKYDACQAATTLFAAVCDILFLCSDYFGFFGGVPSITPQRMKLARTICAKCFT